MTRLLAIDFDAIEVRYVLASPRGRRLKVHAAGSVLLSAESEDTELSPAACGEMLRSALAEQGYGASTALVAIDRAGVELLHLTLPPATDAELPELVANQTLRESHSVGEGAVVDFVPLGDNPAEPRQVMAAVLPAEKLQRIESFCKAARLKPKRIVLRSHAAASLFLRAATAAEQICLLINPVGEEVDLTVLLDRRAVFSRTARLPEAADELQTAEWLLGEIRRTLAVAMQSELGTDRIECVYIFGQADENQDLLTRISEALGIPTKIFDPFAAIGVFRAMVPNCSGRFGSLLGLLLDEADRGTHTLDFLHPRRRPKRLTRWQLGAAAAAVAVVAVLLIGVLQWRAVAARDAEILDQAKTLRSLNEQVKKSRATAKLIATVADWKAGEVLWLEELRELSDQFPGRRDAALLDLSMTSVPSRGGGTITFQGLVRDPTFARLLESKIKNDHRKVVRNEYYRVRSRAVGSGSQRQEYAIQIDTSVFVAKRPKGQYTSHPAVQPPSESSPEESP